MPTETNQPHAYPTQVQNNNYTDPVQMENGGVADPSILNNSYTGLSAPYATTPVKETFRRSRVGTEKSFVPINTSNLSQLSSVKF